MITERELAFTAGLFEGEGTVRINKATKGNLGHLCVSLVNTDRQLIDFLQDRWPAHCRPATGLRADQKPATVWVMASRKAAAFLREIQPYVVSDRMKKRIALALEFQDQKSKSSRVTDEYREMQFSYYLQMRELNVRGVRKGRGND